MLSAQVQARGGRGLGRKAQAAVRRREGGVPEREGSSGCHCWGRWSGRRGEEGGSKRVLKSAREEWEGGTACHCWGRWSGRWRSGDELVRLDFGVESGKYKRNKG